MFLGNLQVLQSDGQPFWVVKSRKCNDKSNDFISFNGNLVPQGRLTKKLLDIHQHKTLFFFIWNDFYI